MEFDILQNTQGKIIYSCGLTYGCYNVQKVGDVVQMCGYEEEDSKMYFIGKGVIQNVAGGMLHSRMINKGYDLLQSLSCIKMTIPYLIPLMETTSNYYNWQCKRHFVVWPIDCLRLYEVA